MIIVLLLIIGVDIFYLNVSFKQERKLLEKKEELERLTTDLISASNYLTTQVRKYALQGNEKYYNNYMDEIENKKTRQKVFEKIKQLDMSKDNLELIEQVRADFKRLESTEKKVLKKVQEMDLLNARSIIFGDFYSKEISKTIGKIDDFKEKLATNLDNKIKNIQNRISVLLMTANVLILIIPVVVILFSVLLYHRLISSIEQATNFADEIASGNLRIEPLERDINDELSTLIESLNRMYIRLKEIVEKLTTSIQELSAYSEQLSANAQEGNATIETTQQHLDNMQSIIQKISDDSQVATELVQNANQQVHNGNQNVKKTITSIKEVDYKVEETVEVIHEFVSKSEKIDRIIELINNIAEQTNLLALNASIEAARAGKKGKVLQWWLKKLEN